MDEKEKLHSCFWHENKILILKGFFLCLNKNV